MTTSKYGPSHTCWLAPKIPAPAPKPTTFATTHRRPSPPTAPSDTHPVSVRSTPCASVLPRVPPTPRRPRTSTQAAARFMAAEAPIAGRRRKDDRRNCPQHSESGRCAGRVTGAAGGRWLHRPPPETRSGHKEHGSGTNRPTLDHDRRLPPDPRNRPGSEGTRDVSRWFTVTDEECAGGSGLAAARA